MTDLFAISRSTVSRRSGFTLIELLVVMGIIVLLLTISVPSLYTLTTVPKMGATRSSMRSLLSSARAKAATSQDYVGVHFQQSPKDNRTYAVIMEKAQGNGYDFGCPSFEPNCSYLTLVASDNQPIALPVGIELAAGDVQDDSFYANPDTIKDATSFTVVLAPNGQIVRKQVVIGQRFTSDGDGRIDTVFFLDVTGNENDPVTPDIAEGMLLLQPDTNFADDELSTGPEISQNSLWIYEQDKRIDAGVEAFTRYIEPQGDKVQFNVYTGTLIDVNTGAQP